MTDYRPLDWDEDYDAYDNVRWEAAGTVYSDAFYYRIRPQLMRSEIVWSVDSSDSELIGNFIDEFESAYAAKEWCEENNRDHFDSIIGSIGTFC